MDSAEQDDSRRKKGSDIVPDKIEALLDLLYVDENNHEGSKDQLLKSPNDRELREGPRGGFEEGNLLIDLTVEADPGPSTLVQFPSPTAKHKGRPDFRRIRQLMDDELPSSSELDVGYDFDTGFETPDGPQTPASSIRLLLPPRSPLLEGISLPSRTISPFDLSSPIGRTESPRNPPRPLSRSSYVTHASPLATFITLATANSTVAMNETGLVSANETGTLSSSLPELTHESSDMSMESSSSLSEPTPDQSEDITGIPSQFNTHDVFGENSIDVTPEIISISEDLLVDQQVQSGQDSSAEEDDRPRRSDSRDLDLAYEELKSLRAECDRLRSLVSQLPGINLDQPKSWDGISQTDTQDDSTITPARLIQRTHSDPSGLGTQESRYQSGGDEQVSCSSPKERDFILKIDQLVWRKSRDVSDVLSPTNLDDLFERILLWERAVRTRYRQRPL